MHHETLIFFVELLSQPYFWILQHIIGPVIVRFDYKTEQEIILLPIWNDLVEKHGLKLKDAHSPVGDQQCLRDTDPLHFYLKWRVSS